MKVHGVACNRNGERGISLVLVAFGMTMFIAAAAFAIDLASLYVGKSEAQRAADAAALAGARQIVASGAISSTLTGNTCPTALQTEAIAAGNQNLVGGQSPGITASNVACDFSRAGDPLVTVSFTATSPVFFIKYFGSTYNSNNVSATATAEAYDPSGATSGPTVCAGCLKPLLVPNCDSAANHLVTAGGNPNCPTIGGKQQAYFLTPPNYTIANPGIAPTGIIGETWQLHVGGPNSTGGPGLSVPSQYGEVAFGNPGGSDFRTNMQQCTTSLIACGTHLQTIDGSKTGPNGQGVGCLITYGTNCTPPGGSATSTDTIAVNTANTPPFTITAHTGNPFFPNNATITQSASLVTVIVYDGSVFRPGQDTVTVVGYMRIFIKDINHGTGGTDDIDTVVIAVSGCGVTGGTCTSVAGTASAGGASFVPIRLVHQ
jgi:Putative Flp pilus-assembly TadE/G-like